MDLRYKPNIARPSPKEIFDRLDQNFNFYLRRQSRESPEEKNEDWIAAARLLSDIFKTRKQVSHLMKEQVDASWDSEEPLSAEELEKLCEKLCFFYDREYNLDPENYALEAQKSQTSPAVMTMRKLLQDESLNATALNLLSSFAFYIQKFYLEEDPIKKRKLENEIELQMTIRDIVMSLPDLVPDEERQKIWLHNLISILKSKVGDMDLEGFLEALDIEGKPTTSIENALRKYFSDQWKDKVEKEKIRIVPFGKKIYILPLQNFYFEEDKEDPKLDQADAFPENGRLVSHRRIDECIGRDVSIFDPQGKKVFWGDLLYKDVGKIQGTYFVLSQKDSYHDVPSEAVVAEGVRASDDPNRPSDRLKDLLPRDKIVLDADYIRIVAMGKIQRGKYIPNPKEV